MDFLPKMNFKKGLLLVAAVSQLTLVSIAQEKKLRKVNIVSD